MLAGAHLPSRPRRLPTLIFCPGSGRLPKPWLLAGRKTLGDESLRTSVLALAATPSWTVRSVLTVVERLELVVADLQSGKIQPVGHATARDRIEKRIRDRRTW